jgi:hypothetical protein
MRISGLHGWTQKAHTPSPQHTHTYTHRAETVLLSNGSIYSGSMVSLCVLCLFHIWICLPWETVNLYRTRTVLCPFIGVCVLSEISKSNFKNCSCLQCSFIDLWVQTVSLEVVWQMLAGLPYQLIDIPKEGQSSCQGSCVLPQKYLYYMTWQENVLYSRAKHRDRNLNLCEASRLVIMCLPYWNFSETLQKIGV